MEDITTAEAARIIGLSINRVRELAKSGELRATKIGRDWIVKRKAAESLASKPRPRRGRKPRCSR